MTHLLLTAYKEDGYCPTYPFFVICVTDEFKNLVKRELDLVQKSRLSKAELNVDLWNLVRLYSLTESFEETDIKPPLSVEQYFELEKNRGFMEIGGFPEVNPYKYVDSLSLIFDTSFANSFPAIYIHAQILKWTAFGEIQSASFSEYILG